MHGKSLMADVAENHYYGSFSELGMTLRKSLHRRDFLKNEIESTRRTMNDNTNLEVLLDADSTRANNISPNLLQNSN